MDFGFSPEQEKFRQEIHEFLENDADAKGAKEEWAAGNGYGPHTWVIMKKLGARGWLTPAWPKEYGGLGLPAMYRALAMEEMDYFTGRGSRGVLCGIGMTGTVLLGHGSEEQKREYLLRISRGEIDFALGYTEPEAGSDLANLSIKAEDKGDYFLVNGQKMFNTACHYAQYHWLGARTQVVEPKYKGISLFIVDLKTPGITIIPIQALGFKTNQIFYDNVKVPKNCLVGELNRGFYYIMEALDHERTYTTSRLNGELEKLIQYAKTSGKSKDPIIRQKLAQLSTEMEIAKLFALRIPWMLDRGMRPTPEAAILKVFYAELQQRVINTAQQILSPYGQLKKDSKWAQLDGEFELEYTASLEGIITRGTCEVMRNIIALRKLGLPAR